MAQQLECDEGVDPRRLDARPRAVGLLVRQNPRLGAADGKTSARLPAQALVGAQELVGNPEEALPAHEARWPRRAVVHLVSRDGVQLIDMGRLRDGAHGPVGDDDHNRHNRGPTPAGELVDVDGRGGRQQHQLRGHGGDAIPVPLAEEGEPDLGHDPRSGDPAAGEDELACPHHAGGLRRDANQLQGKVTLDRRAEVAGGAVVLAPGAVIPLDSSDVVGQLALLFRLVGAEEAVEENELGLHGRVGLQLAPPVAFGVLGAQEVGLGPLHCGRHGVLQVCGRRLAGGPAPLRLHSLHACWTAEGQLSWNQRTARSSAPSTEL